MTRLAGWCLLVLFLSVIPLHAQVSEPCTTLRSCQMLAKVLRVQQQTAENIWAEWVEKTEVCLQQKQKLEEAVEKMKPTEKAMPAEEPAKP